MTDVPKKVLVMLVLAPKLVQQHIYPHVQGLHKMGKVTIFHNVFSGSAGNIITIDIALQATNSSEPSRHDKKDSSNPSSLTLPGSIGV